MDKIVLFLENLSLREKILFLSFLALLGIFLGFKTYEGFLKSFFDETMNFNEQELLEKREQNFILQKDKITLEKELQAQKETLDFYENKMKIFNQNIENHLSELESLAQKYGLSVKKLQDSYKEEKDFKKYHLFLEFEGEFKSLLQLIQDLENLNYEFHRIELETAGFKLNVKINLSFINLA